MGIEEGSCWPYAKDRNWDWQGGGRARAVDRSIFKSAPLTEDLRGIEERVVGYSVQSHINDMRNLVFDVGECVSILILRTMQGSQSVACNKSIQMRCIFLEYAS